MAPSGSSSFCSLVWSGNVVSYQPKVTYLRMWNKYSFFQNQRPLFPYNEFCLTGLILMDFIITPVTDFFTPVDGLFAGCWICRFILHSGDTLAWWGAKHAEYERLWIVATFHHLLFVTKSQLPIYKQVYQSTIYLQRMEEIISVQIYHQHYLPHSGPLCGKLTSC